MNEIIVAVIAFLGTLAGSYFSQRKSAILIAYKLEQLETKVGKHNNMIERMYIVEGRVEGLCDKVKVVNHRIDDLEKDRG